MVAVNAQDNSREGFLFMVLVAEEAKRFDDMVAYAVKMIKAAEGDGELPTRQERSLLVKAFKMVVNPLRVARAVMGAEEAKREAEKVRLRTVDDPTSGDVEKASASEDGNDCLAAIARRYRLRIEEEICSKCEELIALLDQHVLRHIFCQQYTFEDVDFAERTAYFLTTKADFSRYITEIEGTQEDAVNAALSSYIAAQEIVMKKLPPTHPTRLALVLNLSVFYFENLHHRDKAYNIAKEALHEAIVNIDTSFEDDLYQESTATIMKILESNINLWSLDVNVDDNKENILPSKAISKTTLDKSKKQFGYSSN